MMEARNRRPIAKRLVGGLALAALSVSSPAAAAEETPLRVVGHWRVMEAAPLLAAADSLPEGSVEIGSGGVHSLWGVPYDATLPSQDSESTRLPDLAGNAETQALRQSVKHPDLRILMTVTEGMYRIIARKSSGIRTLADLKGKRIARAASSAAPTSAVYYLHKMLDRIGLNEADVKVISSDTIDAANMLAAGTIDAVALWEPEPERVRRFLGKEAVEFHEFGVYRELYNLNTTAATLADPVKRRQTVDFVRALINACHDATYNPARAQELTAKTTRYDLELIKAAWPHHRFACSMPTDLLDVLVEEEQWLATQEKRKPRDRAQLSRLIDTSILTEALAK